MCNITRARNIDTLKCPRKNFFIEEKSNQSENILTVVLVFVVGSIVVESNVTPTSKLSSAIGTQPTVVVSSDLLIGIADTVVNSSS